MAANRTASVTLNTSMGTVSLAIQVASHDLPELLIDPVGDDGRVFSGSWLARRANDGSHTGFYELLVPRRR